MIFILRQIFIRANNTFSWSLCSDCASAVSKMDDYDEFFGCLRRFLSLIGKKSLIVHEELCKLLSGMTVLLSGTVIPLRGTVVPLRYFENCSA